MGHAHQEEAIQQCETKKTILVGKRQDAIKRVQQGDDEDAEAELGEIERQIRELTPVKKTTLWADDATPESLAVLLSRNEGRMSLLSAEGGLFDMMAGKYSAGINLDVYLKAWSQDAIRVNRKGQAHTGEDGFTILDPTLTVAVTVQPAVMSGLSAKAAMLGRGLMARFFYIYPADLAGSRQTDTNDIPTDLIAEYDRFIRTIGSWKPSVVDVVGEGGQGSSAPHTIRMSKEARRLRSQFEGEIDKRLARGRDLHGMADWGGKLVGQCVRVAGLLHLSRYWDDPAPWLFELSEDTMQDAITFGRYGIHHARATYSEMHADPIEADAMKLLDWILGNGFSEFSQRDVQRNLNAFRRADDAKQSLQLLAEHAYIRESVLLGEAGRKRKVWEVNPALYTDVSPTKDVLVPPIPTEKPLEFREAITESDWETVYDLPKCGEDGDLEIPDWGKLMERREDAETCAA